LTTLGSVPGALLACSTIPVHGTVQLSRTLPHQELPGQAEMQHLKPQIAR
jgi:hypothetical protein